MRPSSWWMQPTSTHATGKSRGWAQLPASAACPACAAAPPAFSPFSGRAGKGARSSGSTVGCYPAFCLPSPCFYTTPPVYGVTKSCNSVLLHACHSSQLSIAWLCFIPQGYSKEDWRQHRLFLISSGSLLWREQTTVGCSEDVLWDLPGDPSFCHHGLGAYSFLPAHTYPPSVAML